MGAVEGTSNRPDYSNFGSSRTHPRSSGRLTGRSPAGPTIVRLGWGESPHMPPCGAAHLPASSPSVNRLLAGPAERSRCMSSLMPPTAWSSVGPARARYGDLGRCGGGYVTRSEFGTAGRCRPGERSTSQRGRATARCPDTCLPAVAVKRQTPRGSVKSSHPVS